jgi:hypothetical protein
VTNRTKLILSGRIEECGHSEASGNLHGTVPPRKTIDLILRRPRFNLKCRQRVSRTWQKTLFGRLAFAAYRPLLGQRKQSGRRFPAASVRLDESRQMRRGEGSAGPPAVGQKAHAQEADDHHGPSRRFGDSLGRESLGRSDKSGNSSCSSTICVPDV